MGIARRRFPRLRPLTGRFRGDLERQELAGKRPSHSAVAAGLTGLHFSLLGDLQGIVNFDPKIPDGAFQLGVT